MSIIRLIHIKLDPAAMDTALQVWSTECAPLMIQQKEKRDFGKASALPTCRRAHFLFGMGQRSRHRALPQERGAQGDRAACPRPRRRAGRGSSSTTW